VVGAIIARVSVRGSLASSARALIIFLAVRALAVVQLVLLRVGVLLGALRVPCDLFVHLAEQRVHEPAGLVLQEVFELFDAVASHGVQRGVLLE
jgi:hypothetical protein